MSSTSKKKENVKLRAIHRIEKRELIKRLVSEMREFNKSGNRTYRTFKVRKRKKGFRVITEPIGEYKQVLKGMNKVLRTGFIDLLSSMHSTTCLNSPRALEDKLAKHAFDEPAALNLVIRIDLKDAFSSVTRGHLTRIVMKHCNVHLVEPVIECLDLAFHPVRQNLLPQGFPTSPVVFDVCAQEIDYRVQYSLKKAFNSMMPGGVDLWNFKYLRYLDDIIIFCSAIPDQTLPLNYLTTVVAQAIRPVGFRINRNKTKFMSWDVPTRHKDIIQEGVQILGLHMDLNVGRPVMKAKKAPRNQLRTLLHIWKKSPANATKELLDRINGHIAWIGETDESIAQFNAWQANAKTIDPISL